MTQNKEDQAQTVALNLLAQREHARSELRNKLLLRGFEASNIELILAELSDKGWQSDERFMTHYVAERYQRGFGPLSILSSLQELGVETALIEEALSLPQFNWQARAGEVLAKRFGEKPTPVDKKARFLQSRGFTAEQIAKACLRGEVHAHE